MGWNLSGRKLQLCAMSNIHMEVGRVTESLPRNDAYVLIFVSLFFIKKFWARNFGSAAAAPAAPAPTALLYNYIMNYATAGS